MTSKCKTQPLTWIKGVGTFERPTYLYTTFSKIFNLINAGSKINDKDSERVPTASVDKEMTITRIIWKFCWYLMFLQKKVCCNYSSLSPKIWHIYWFSCNIRKMLWRQLPKKLLHFLIQLIQPYQHRTKQNFSNYLHT